MCLRVMEKDTRDVRNPEKYYFWIFGTPSETGTWGYRVEGHHLSQTFTIANGKVMAAPSFYGTNPAEIREGPRTGLRVLGAERTWRATWRSRSMRLRRKPRSSWRRRPPTS